MEKKLEQIKWDLLEKEGISKSDLELVDLKFGFTPVIPCKGDSPYEAVETKGGGYLLVNHPLFKDSISSEELKVMRYRFLSNRSNPFVR